MLFYRLCARESQSVPYSMDDAGGGGRKLLRKPSADAGYRWLTGENLAKGNGHRRVHRAPALPGSGDGAGDGQYPIYFVPQSEIDRP